MKDFIYHNPCKLYFGLNHYDKIKEEIKIYGKRILLLYGGGSIKKSGLYNRLIEELKGLDIFEFGGIRANPEIDKINKAIIFASKNKIDIILAVGGGSVIDASKLIAAAYYIEEKPWNIIKNRIEIKKALPIIAVLTVAATGSEMNGTSVISNDKTKEKLSISSPLLIPKVAFLDPSLTKTLSLYQSACGIADIFAHIFETYFNNEGSLDYLDSIMEAMMKSVIDNGRKLMLSPDDLDLRANILYASTWAINGFIRSSQSCTWSCHSIGHQLTAYYDITHGESLALVMPRWLRYIKEYDDNYIYKLGKNVFMLDIKERDRLIDKTIEALEDFLYKDLNMKRYLDIDISLLNEMAFKATKGDIIKGYINLNKEDVKKLYQMLKS